ncbi:hypothetical protein NEAUS06_0594 [Nematocida ausubeli]|nr:hypothetical protein NEAUS06_0594 [Nematocida ausubeli]
MDIFSTKIFMSDDIRTVHMQRTLVDEIAFAEPLKNADKIKKISGIYKDFRFSESESAPFATPLAITKGLRFEEKEASWNFLNFFPDMPSITARDKDSRPRNFRPRSTIIMNRALDKGAPYLMYSLDGRKYTIRKERATDSTDTVAVINRELEPIKIELYRNTAHFLNEDHLDIIECTRLTKHRINLSNAVDMSVPEKGGTIIPILKEMEERKGINTKKMYLDRVDMATGKIDNYVLNCPGTLEKYKRISNTWHPQEYIIMSSGTAGIIDLREKKSRTFWNCREILAHPGENFNEYHKIEKGAGSKIYITNGGTLGSFDMRNLTTPYGICNTNLRNGVLSMGRHPAVYNNSGKFFFQSATDPDNCIMKIYNFNTTDKLLGFEWVGRSANLPYSMAAFLFKSRLCIFSGTGEVHEVQIGQKKSQRYKRRDVDKQLSNNKIYTDGFFRKPLKAMKEKAVDSYTILERSLLNGFRDPLDTESAKSTAISPSEDVIKVLGYTKMINYMVPSDTALLLNKSKDEKKEHE